VIRDGAFVIDRLAHGHETSAPSLRKVANA
jgi:hypothetical protein